MSTDAATHDLPAPALVLAHADAAPPAELVDALRETLAGRAVEAVGLEALADRVARASAQEPVVVVPYLLCNGDAGGEAMRAATRGVPFAFTSNALGPHPVLAAELADAVRRSGLRADCGIVVVAEPPAGAQPAGPERPVMTGAVPAQPDPDDLTDEEVAARRDLAQVVYDLDSVWVGPVAGAYAGAQPSVVDVVRFLATDGRDVAVVQHALRDVDLDTERLALVGAAVVVRPGLDQRRVGVVVDRYEQGVAELRAGLDEDAWTTPLV